MSLALVASLSAPAFAQAPGESAAELYAESGEAADSGEPLVGYDKGFFIRSADGSFELRTQGRVQARYTFESIDPGDGADTETEMQFSIPRARIKMAGHAFSDEWRYTVQIDFGKGFVGLKDYYVEYRPSSDFRVRVGQYKRPFSRQQINSSGRLQFVDRAITDRAFGSGRDIGIMLHNGIGGSREDGFEWAVGIFNGTGDKGRFSGSTTVDLDTGEGDVSGGFSNVPDNFQPAVVGRVGYVLGDMPSYRESDLRSGDRPFALGIGASGEAHFDVDDDTESSIRAQFDYSLLASGFSSTGAFYFRSDEEGSESASTIGLHAQAGYLIGDLFEPSLRFAMIDPEGDDNNLQELALGLSFYFFGHNIKWQTDAGMLSAQAGSDDIFARSQLQLAF